MDARIRYKSKAEVEAFNSGWGDQEMASGRAGASTESCGEESSLGGREKN